mmetsp:Transcript_10590/g.35904  ORF Transcript_10590/g.35904 Transcript_10590/m.35904 type:complete len:335 (+) Transcript_10590:82-1086(+)
MPASLIDRAISGHCAIARPQARPHEPRRAHGPHGKAPTRSPRARVQHWRAAPESPAPPPSRSATCAVRAIGRPRAPGWDSSPEASAVLRKASPREVIRPTPGVHRRTRVSGVSAGPAPRAPSAQRAPERGPGAAPSAIVLLGLGPAARGHLHRRRRNLHPRPRPGPRGREPLHVHDEHGDVVARPAAEREVAEGLGPVQGARRLVEDLAAGRLLDHVPQAIRREDDKRVRGPYGHVRQLGLSAHAVALQVPVPEGPGHREVPRDAPAALVDHPPARRADAFLLVRAVRLVILAQGHAAAVLLHEGAAGVAHVGDRQLAVALQHRGDRRGAVRKA